MTTLAPMIEQDHLTRVAARCAYASGIVSTFGIVPLVAFFTTFIRPLGILNHIAVVIQYALMLPIAMALHQLLRPLRPTLSLASLLLGMPGMLAVIVIQVPFVSAVLSYGRYLVLVSFGFLVVLPGFCWSVI